MMIAAIGVSSTSSNVSMNQGSSEKAVDAPMSGTPKTETDPARKREESPKEGPSTREAATKSASPHKMKDTVHIGYTTYAAWRAWWSDQLSSNEILDSPPDASYLFVEISVRNDDKKPRAIPPFTLIDENGAEYQTCAKAWAVEGSIGVLDSLNPSVRKQGFIVFDVPRNHRYSLKVSGGYWSGEQAMIELVAVDPEMESRRLTAEAEASKRKRDDVEEEQKRIKEEARAAELAAKEAHQKELDDAKWRTWISADGKFKTEAKFIAYAGGSVSLKKKDGVIVRLPLESLSKDDQDFITQRKWLKKVPSGKAAD